ncbi:MAG TPA: gamma-glutamyl-gamma-aminobutyrate hydrolase family protein [Candidatus Saccharimonadales bacterium]
MQPLIAITASEVINNGETWLPIVYGQYRTYIDAVTRAGGAPFIIPLTDDETALRRLYDACDGLVMSGGNDLDSATYNMPPSPKKLKASKHPLLSRISPRRDRQEVRLIRWALDDNKPVLGICRGMQMLNVALGGNLHQDITGYLPSAHNHEANIDKKTFHHLAHKLKIAEDSQLASILGVDTIATNTLHHQAIDRLGDGLVATAYAEDGLIEAIELPGKRFAVGIQSHPEALEAEIETLWQKLFSAFVDSAAEVVRLRT